MDPYADAPRCPWLAADAVPACDFDPGCSVHGGQKDSYADAPEGWDAGIQDHLYNENCPRTCCGGSEPTTGLCPWHGLPDCNDPDCLSTPHDTSHDL